MRHTSPWPSCGIMTFYSTRNSHSETPPKFPGIWRKGRGTEVVPRTFRTRKFLMTTKRYTSRQNQLQTLTPLPDCPQVPTAIPTKDRKPQTHGRFNQNTSREHAIANKRKKHPEHVEYNCGGIPTNCMYERGREGEITRRWPRSIAWCCYPVERRWCLRADHVATAWSLASTSSSTGSTWCMALHLAAPLRLLGGKDLRHQSVLAMDVAMRKHARCVRSGARGFAKTATTTGGRGGPWLWGMVVGGTLDEADACVSYGKRLPRLAATRVNYSGQTAADRCVLTHTDAGRSRWPRASLRHDPSLANHPLESSFFSFRSYFILFV